MTMELPQDVLERILLFVGNPTEIARCGRVCSSYQKASNAPHLWQQLAHAKFGRQVAEQSLPLYQSSWKRLMIHDNKHGAMPTIAGPKLSTYRHNRTDYFFCCIVECVMWDRVNDLLRVYIDVRGEPDLRRPMGSSLALRNATNDRVQLSHPGGPFAHAFHLGQRALARPGRPLKFVAEKPVTNQHYKGYLTFPASHAPGKYTFCYANSASHQGRGPDYLPVTLFQIPTNNRGLEQVFQVNGKTEYTFNQSPFAEDTPERERARFEAVVPPEVMNRPRPWYV